PIYSHPFGMVHFRTVVIPMLDGRDFTERDTPETREVEVINETMARRYFEGRSAIGGRVRIGPRTVEVVGVAHDGKYGSVTEPSRPFMYLPLQQWYRSDVVLVVATRGDPTPLVPA